MNFDSPAKGCSKHYIISYIYIYSYIIVYCDCEIREQFSGKISEMVLNTYFLLTKVDFPT